ncbi:type I restriction enzyme, S subunit [Variovorax sp. PDC80]|uniref:restriction endonuclease subunit S n=1 Tax=Variovorax sp. PDC80 TaxID=1882827 RepID=UPI0008F1D0A2|nr:restriction endonuclease subunit S [Variovorax sp. PDC80]SFP09187.1 type I restriction enzyme, S subunit [Variovorax sp. PDC80]
MSSEWELVQLSDLVTIKHGWPFKSEFFVSDDGSFDRPIVVAVGNFDYSGGFRFGSTQIKTYANDFPQEYRLEPGDILLVMTCQTAGGEILGIPGRIPSDGRIYLHNQRLGKVVLQHSGVSRDFLYWLFLYKDFNRHLVSSATGTKILHTAPRRIESFRFPLPPLREQKAIAALLGILDDRIALLRETSATLEAIAQALFKSWFIDFDPVRAKMKGCAPEGMDEAMAALFPDEMDESGLVPRGWSRCRLESMMELLYGKALKANDRLPGDVPVYGSGGITGFHHERLVDGPSIIVGRKGTVGSLYWEDRPFFPIDTVFYVRSATPLTYCFYLLQTLGLQGMNTDGAVPGLNRGNVYRLLVPKAAPEVVAAFDSVVTTLRQAIYQKAEQARTLTALREVLLPRLISGRLRLPEFRCHVDEAIAA